ncbi:MAG: site-specific DNA-methyltransferase [Mangrovibacterium sp.]
MKLDLQSPDLVNENIEKLAALFPNCITESANGKAIDFDLLKQELNHAVVEGNKERYTLNWPGKREAILTANTQTTQTLRPVREDSVDFDNTENLYIEGDNLEVLKLLQESYLNQVKMIYIDPPYNTGKDFVYRDNFTMNSEEWLVDSGQKDEYGVRMVANPETAGRYHSDWLTMMYPRLKLARNLLKEDGVIFISIDDNEVHNLRKLCDEIFGEGNFVANLIWQKKTGASDAVSIATITESILVYVKDFNNILNLFSKNSESYDLNRYRYNDEYSEERGPYYIDNLDRGGLQYSDSLNYPIECPDGTMTYPNGRTEYYNDGWIWKWSKSKIEWARKNKFIEFRKSENKESGWSVCYKNYLKVDNENNPIERAAPHKNMITSILNANSSADMKSLFNERVFQYTKPVDLIVYILKLINVNNNSLILDFFSGSATTTHAVMQLNAEDGGNRKFIMVQLPEQTDEKSEAYKAGYKNICEIGKERIRRAGKKVKEEKRAKAEKDGLFADFTDTQDYGFRVYRLDSSNMQDVYYRPQDMQPNLLDQLADNVKPDRTPDDLLAQIMLAWGLPLSLKIEQAQVCGKQVFKVENNSLYACFDNDIDEAFAKEIAKEEPLRIVFHDNGFAHDTAKINVQQLLKQLSPRTEMKVI